MSKNEYNDYNREAPLAESNKGLFLEKLDTMQAWLSGNGISYRILGSLAVSSYLDPSLKKMDFDRMGGFSNDQKVPDIDLLVQRQDVPQVYAYGEKLLSDSSFPVRLDLVAGIKHIDLEEDHDTSHLIHKNLRVPFDTKLMAQKIRPFGQTSIVTVDPLTLQHTFGVWGGIIREKDLPKVRALIEYNKGEQAIVFTENDFEAFHSFLRARRKEYPLYSKARKAEIAVAGMLPKPAENFLRIIYKRKDAKGGKT